MVEKSRTLPDRDTLVGIWRAVLRDPGLDADTSFLEAGGTSITALRLRARLRDTCGVDVEVRMLVENPTPDELLSALAEGTVQAGGRSETEGVV